MEHIDETTLRKHCQAYVRAAVESSGLSRREFANKSGDYTEYALAKYINGTNCPGLERLLAMYNLTAVAPDDYGLPLLDALDCVDQMRDMFVKGRSVSYFVKATGMRKDVIENLIEFRAVSLKSILKFRDIWIKKNIPRRIEDGVFLPTMRFNADDSRSERELHWIETMWKSLAKTAQQIRDGFWIWYTDSLFRLELEHIADDRYTFRSVIRKNEQIFTSREVQI